MSIDELSTTRTERTIAITSTFTAEPLERALSFWLEELEIPARIVFAPYNQVFQELLDPSSLLATNRGGINIVLIRFEDWQRSAGGAHDAELSLPLLRKNAREFAHAITASAERTATPQLVFICPSSPAIVAEPERKTIFEQMADLLKEELKQTPGVYLISSSELFGSYPVTEYYDPHGDRLAHVPFTPLFFTALATMIARKIYSLTSKPYKVIVLDCDQTLWGGVCGEDGALGVQITPPWKKIQEFLLQQYDAGMLLCLCSKNNEEDVAEVFTCRPDMPLTFDHFVARRINWKPKSENIRALARELNLGSDSFIFLDDDPVECAEVQSNCPEVLTFQVARDPGQTVRLLSNLWILDHLKVTGDGQRRNLTYRQSAERERFRKSVFSFDEFLAGLNLKIEISPMATHQVVRFAELTQRTNQFNVATHPRSEGEIRRLCQSEYLECLSVNVKDRFGDYGLVGAVVFKAAESILVDTFLLSCRALGKGVEHRMLSRLGEIADERGLNEVVVHYHQTKKNGSALEFLDGVGSDFKQAVQGGFLFRFPARYAAAIKYRLERLDATPTTSAEGAAVSLMPSEFDEAREKASLLASIAAEMHDVESIQRAILQTRPTVRRGLVPFVSPRTPLENRLAQVWSELLGLERVGVQDNFFDLGGHSLLAMQVLARVRKDLSVDLSPRVFFTTELTIAGLCREIVAQQVQAESSNEVETVLQNLDALSDDQVKALLAEAEESCD